jgi:iron complex transport system ATP-binding protein
MAVIEIEKLCFGYTQTPILAELSMSIDAGSFCAIAGPNGAGKSTLIQLLAGLLKPDKGTIQINGKKLNSYKTRELSRQIALVRQEYVPVFGFTVLEMVMMARLSREDFILFENEDDRRIVAEVLEQTEIISLAQRKLNELSGGERQRVFIARALAQETPILLLDEPTNHLDMKHQVRIFDLLKKLQTEHKKTILAVTHDLNIACQYCNRAMLLAAGGEISWGDPSEVFAIERLKRIFEVEGFQGVVRSKPFFIPLGRGAYDAQTGQKIT